MKKYGHKEKNMVFDENKDDGPESGKSKRLIEERVEKARFRYNFFRCEMVLFTVLAIGLSMALITLVVRKFVEVPYYVSIILISVFSIYFFVTLASLIVNWIGKSEAANLLDKEMHLKERLVTGLEYADQEKSNRLLDLLVADITTQLDDKGIKAAIPHKLPGATKFLIPVAILLLLLLILPLIYPVESERIVKEIKGSITEIPVSKEDEKETDQPEDLEIGDKVVDKEPESVQEERSGESLYDVGDSEIADDGGEKSKQEQEDKIIAESLQGEGELQHKTMTLEEKVSALLSKLNNILNNRDNK
ncbi:MAG: hypothetical protein GY941_05865, partial [Planctomycetes bacterium]|nr:hypothetical protein [Planctomycetota bacterium]